MNRYLMAVAFFFLNASALFAQRHGEAMPCKCFAIRGVAHQGTLLTSNELPG
jgi:hypothetical protein